ncbi:MAG: reverse transcriptase domain-containing protein [bacterium]|nr:reverse transcriptase domain-containing protein [bacterium]
MNQRQIWRGGGIKSHNIFERIISLENLFLAWKEFRRGKRKKSDVQQFEFNLEDNLFQLHQELKDKIYKPDLYTAFYVQDPKLRHIHKASVRDRVLHQAIFRILYVIFDKGFIYDSDSSRLGKGTHIAVERLGIFLRKLSKNYCKPVFVLKCDISKFFDSIDQQILLNLIKKKIFDPKDIWLIEKVIKSFEKNPDKGLPLGNVTSQLFANIYLNELDQFIKHKLKIKHYLRYCDDFVVLSDTKENFIGITDKVSKFLADNLNLTLHPNKIIIRKFSQGIDFLGYIARPHYRILRTKTKRRLLRKINGKNLQSYLGLLKHCQGYKIQKQLNELQ